MLHSKVSIFCKSRDSWSKLAIFDAPLLTYFKGKCSRIKYLSSNAHQNNMNKDLSLLPNVKFYVWYNQRSKNLMTSFSQKQNNANVFSQAFWSDIVRVMSRFILDTLFVRIYLIWHTMKHVTKTAKPGTLKRWHCYASACQQQNREVTCEQKFSSQLQTCRFSYMLNITINHPNIKKFAEGL